ncbi:cytochrome P450 [Xylariaceae sp. FL0804]|nr:cytochrome P450 [Xylariaceae sp. FL0804]
MDLLPHHSMANVAIMLLTSGVAYYLTWAAYALFLHPLREFPGPVTHRVSWLPRQYHLVRGELPFHVAALHARYGPVVRITPDELAISTPRAWRDIYGHRSSAEPELPKSERFYRMAKHAPRNILNADREEHSMLRRLTSHGFSERSMRGQEPIIGSYVDLLVRRLRAQSAGGEKPVNMREWLNWTTFDIIGDLGLGSSFGCLEQSDYHPWVARIMQGVRQATLLSAAASLGLRKPIEWVARSGLLAQNKSINLMREKMQARVAKADVERPDLIEGLVRARAKLGGDDDDQMRKLTSNAQFFVAAGSETTATLLSGAVFLLSSHPAAYARVVDEVRGTFASDEEITLLSVQRLPYMLAVLNESLRHYPPVTTGLPRQVPRGGTIIDGHFVPENTVVAVWQWAINHSLDYWTEPQSFVPERWMGDVRFADDQLEACQPFSVGPRNCIGRNLAYAEMRLILAKILYNFDMKLDDGSRDWLQTQKAYVIWDKPDLNVHLTPVAR